MKKVLKDESKKAKKPLRPAINQEVRENQLIALAIDLAEEQLRNGTASSQVITHYLKLGSSKERLEREKLEEENKLLRAKTDAIQSAKHSEELYADAIKAFRQYNGQKEVPDEDIQ